ncbi:hypothetical protein IGI04_037556 [Brassica rapa subsp. trilocularis]|uniref:Uncharacterized protein n=1 Tax=Brassica rapa subsp. trilocularis TaxID=1813537 RepID=A0ABQ7LHQ3_BRACM|nr:hypothetical protein IGI04_037556 [Brassica rapa subsp. trilocularis]
MDLSLFLPSIIFERERIALFPMLDQSGEVFNPYISVVFDFVCAESSYCGSQILSVAFSCLRYVFGGIPIRPSGNGLPLGKSSKFSKKCSVNSQLLTGFVYKRKPTSKLSP